jgi:hypothetical protein
MSDLKLLRALAIGLPNEDTGREACASRNPHIRSCCRGLG